MFFGLIAGLSTGALWGLSFVAPRVVLPYSAWDLAVGRYVLFGLLSVLLMLAPRFRLTGLSARPLVTALVLGGTGNVCYFVCAAFAVQLAGSALPPLIIGTMPVALAVIANLRERSVPWRALLAPLTLIAAGIAIVNVSVISAADAGQREHILLGIGCSVGGLAVWISYSLINASVMRAPNPPSTLGWTGAQGIGAALVGLLLLPLTTLGAGPGPAFSPIAAVADSDAMRFLGWVLVMGLLVSWLGTWCWGIASRRLPLALTAQLTVTSTVFGLLYGFILEARWPTAPEWVGSALQLIGVGVGVAIFSRPAAMPLPLPARKQAAPLA